MLDGLEGAHCCLYAYVTAVAPHAVFDQLHCSASAESVMSRAQPTRAAALTPCSALSLLLVHVPDCGVLWR
jgi:hypothetical protein